MSSKSIKFIYMGDPQPSRLKGAGPDYSQWGKLLRLASDRAYPGTAESPRGMPPQEGLLLLGGDLVNRGTLENRREDWEAFFEAGGRSYGQSKGCQPGELLFL